MIQRKGFLITFEGGEGSGKTTVFESLFKDLRREGYSLIKTREPGGTKLGEEARHLVLKKREDFFFSERAELALYMVSRAQQVDEVILPALSDGKIILCDRFNDSSVAYQGYARGIGEKKVREICHFFSQGLEPDLTIYLDIDPKIGLERVRKIPKRKTDRIEEETISFHEKLRQGYIRIVQENPKRVRLIDASQPIEKVLQEAKKLISSLLIT